MQHSCTVATSDMNEGRMNATGGGGGRACAQSVLAVHSARIMLAIQSCDCGKCVVGSFASFCQLWQLFHKQRISLAACLAYPLPFRTVGLLARRCWHLMARCKRALSRVTD